MSARLYRSQIARTLSTRVGYSGRGPRTNWVAIPKCGACISAAVFLSISFLSSRVCHAWFPVPVGKGTLKGTPGLTGDRYGIASTKTELESRSTADPHTWPDADGQRACLEQARVEGDDQHRNR